MSGSFGDEAETLLLNEHAICNAAESPLYKAPSTSATMSKRRSTLSKQHSTLFPKRQQCRTSLSQNFVISTESKHIEHV